MTKLINRQSSASQVTGNVIGDNPSNVVLRLVVTANCHPTFMRL